MNIIRSFELNLFFQTWDSQFQNVRVLIFFSWFFFVKTQKAKCAKKIRTKCSWVSISRILVWTNFSDCWVLIFFFVFLALFSDFCSEVVSILTPFFLKFVLEPEQVFLFLFSFLTTILILKPFFVFLIQLFILCYLWSWPFIFWSWNPFSFFSWDHFFFSMILRLFFHRIRNFFLNAVCIFSNLYYLATPWEKKSRKQKINH